MAIYTAVALLCSLLVLSAKCDGVVEQPGPFDSSIVTSADQPATPDDPNKLIPFDELSPELKVQVGKLISQQLKEEQEKKLAEQKNAENPVLTAVKQGDSYILNTDSLPKEVKEDVLRQLVELAANTQPIKQEESPAERLATGMAEYLTRMGDGQLNVDEPVDFDDLPEGLRRELDNYLGTKQESDKVYGQNDLVEKNKQGESAAVLGGEFLGGLLGGALGGGGGYPGGYYPGGNRPGGYPGGYPGSYPGGYPGSYPGGYPGSYPGGGYPGGGYPGGGYPGSYPGSGYPGAGYPGGQYGGYRPSTGSYPAAYQQPSSSSSYNTGKFRQQYYASPYQAFYASPYQSYSAQPYVSSVAGYYPYSSPVSSYYQPMSYGYRKQSMPYHQPGAYSVAPGQSLRIIPSGSALSYQPKEILPKTGFNPVYYLVPQRKL